MLFVLCAECDEFISVHKTLAHTEEAHPQLELLHLRTWPDGTLVISIEDELDLYL